MLQVNTRPSVFSISWTSWFMFQAHALLILFGSTENLWAWLPFLRKAVTERGMCVVRVSFLMCCLLTISSVRISGGAMPSRVVKVS